jgi:hypothetical protein
MNTEFRFIGTGNSKTLESSRAVALCPIALTKPLERTRFAISASILLKLILALEILSKFTGVIKLLMR